MRLFIAEKPSLARAIADVLPKPHRKGDGFIECGNGQVVTWCIGHLLEQAQPDVYDSRYARWNLNDLPIVPEKWRLQPRPSVTKQLNVIKRFLHEASEVVHAGDPDREGQLLVDEVLDYLELPPEKRREFLASSGEQLERIEWLVASLLTLSRIDADVITFKKEAVSISQLLAKAAEPLAAPMEAENIVLRNTCPPDIHWQGDGGWTAEALTNVLKNAVEYSPAGGTITVCVAENPLHTEIVVTDEGPGFAEEDLPFLFQRFYKGQKAQSGSVGIGLALAKTILQSQNGDIFACNAPEGGARFIIKLYKQTV